MTKITFYNGLKEIGGTFVCLETETTRCMFDYGFSVSEKVDSDIFKRDESYAADYVNLGMLNGADGIFDIETAAKTGYKPYEARDKECFFLISHMHIDHMGGLGCLHSDIPVYMSEESVLLYSELAHNEDVEHRAHVKCFAIPAYDCVRVGDITVKCVPVDHDIMGACGFLITTPDGNVCYTGDYRLHGFHPEITEKFANVCKGTDVLITEGVSLSFDEIDILSLTKPEEAPRTEYDLQNEVKEYCNTSEGLLIINPYERNIERVHELIKTIRGTGRRLLLDIKLANYVHAFFPSDDICVYAPFLEYNNVDNDSISVDQSVEYTVVSKEEVLNNPAKYVIQLNYAYSFELLDLKNITSKYIHMDGTPIGAYDPSFKKLSELLSFLEIEYVFASLGGHAKPYYLRTIIDTIAPKNLVPLHTFKPEQVNSSFAKTRILPDYKDSFQLKNGQLIKLN